MADWTPNDSDSKIWASQYLPSEYLSATQTSKASSRMHDNSIIVHAWPLCKVSICHPFQITSDDLLSSEDDVHGSNLEKIMCAHAVRQPDAGHFHGRPLAIYEKALTEAQRKGGEDSPYTKYLDLIWYFGHRNRTGRQLLEYLRSTESLSWFTPRLPTWLNFHSKYRAWSASERNEIFKVHVRICNYMARAEQRYFYPEAFHIGATNVAGLDRGRRPVFGAGTGDVQANDLVLLVPGVKLPLIVRKTDDGHVRLVGLAMLPFVNSGYTWRALSKRVKENLPEFTIV